MITTHLVFFDHAYQVIGHWTLENNQLMTIELFPQEKPWYEEQVATWQREGFEIMEHVISPDKKIFSLQTVHIPCQSPDARAAFLTVCRARNWPTLLLSDRNYHLWLQSFKTEPRIAFRSGQALAEPDVAFA